MRIALLDGQGGTVCPRLSVADKPRARMKGLLGKRALDSDEGLLLRPAASVHTAFMRFSIDVIFLDRSLRVMDVEPNVRPWRMVGKRGAKAVLELPAGEAKRRGIERGMALSVGEPRETDDAR